MSRETPPHVLRAQARVGTVLGGKYRLGRVLGVGGMAAVYAATHRNGNRVAVKVLHPELSIDGDLRRRFAREGYAANAIGHPGVVRVLDDDTTADGVPFLVMELLDGETLEVRRKARGGVLGPMEVLALGHQLLDVLAAAHARGVVHRDIKPDNLFVTRAGALKVLDFGIARLRSSSEATATWTGARMGTPAFMPPEQALGRTSQVDARSDVWSAGATLFTLLSGQIVHAADTPDEVVVRVATQPARSLAEAAPSVPPPIVALVDRALRFASADRWQSAGEMRDAIADAHVALCGEPLAVASVAEPPPSLKAPEGGDAAWDDEPGETMVDSPAPAAGATTRLEGPCSDATISPTTQSTTAPPTLPEPPEPVPQSRDPRSDPPARPAPRGVPRPVGSRRRAATAVLSLVLLAAAVLVGRVTSPRASTPAASAPVSAGAGAPHGCVSNAACVAASGGRPAICRRDDGACVALEAEGCRVLAAPSDLTDDATLWIGAMFPVSEPSEMGLGPRSANAVELARRDFAEAAGGLPPIRPGGPKRPLAVVLCDDRLDPVRAAEHLVGDLRVPAILGFARSKEVLDLADAYFLPRGVLALAANTASALRSIPHAPGEPRLVWRVTTSAETNQPVVAALLSTVVEPELRAARGVLSPGEPMRVAIVRNDNASGQSHADLLVPLLRWNGKSAAENGDALRQVVVPDPLASEHAADVARAARELAAFRPHVVLQAAAETTYIVAVEAAWPADARFRPRHLLGELPTEPGLLDYLRTSPEAARRILGVDASMSAPAFTRFILHYNEVFSPHITSADMDWAPYDAFYLAAYAAAALGDKPITGRALAGALSRLGPPGERVEVGPGGIYPAYYALAAGKNVDLQGIASTLNFDPETGDPTVRLSVYCLAPAGVGAVPRLVESGLFFPEGSTRPEGTMHCP